MGTLSETLRQTIDEALLGRFNSLTELNEEANIPTGSVSRFLSGARGLNLDTADKLARVLGLELTKKPSEPKS